MHPILPPCHTYAERISLALSAAVVVRRLRGLDHPTRERGASPGPVAVVAPEVIALFPFRRCELQPLRRKKR